MGSSSGSVTSFHLRIELECDCSSCCELSEAAAAKKSSCNTASALTSCFAQTKYGTTNDVGSTTHQPPVIASARSIQMFQDRPHDEGLPVNLLGICVPHSIIDATRTYDRKQESGSDEQHGAISSYKSGDATERGKMPLCPPCLHRIDPQRLGLPKPKNHHLSSKFCLMPSTASGIMAVAGMETAGVAAASSMTTCQNQLFLTPWPSPNYCSACYAISQNWETNRGSIDLEQEFRLSLTLGREERTLLASNNTDDTQLVMPAAGPPESSDNVASRTSSTIRTTTTTTQSRVKKDGLFCYKSLLLQVRHDRKSLGMSFVWSCRMWKIFAWSCKGALSRKWPCILTRISFIAHMGVHHRGIFSKG
jgi:hypothetical protein